MAHWIDPPTDTDDIEVLLIEARHLNLVYFPEDGAAVGMVLSLLPLVVAHERPTRTNNRGPSGMKNLEEALGAIIGGVLIAWSRKGSRAVYRSLMADRFTGIRVGIKAFKPAMTALVALGFLNHSGGISYPGAFHEDGDPFERRAGRWWPTTKLLSLASEFGLEPDNIRPAFKSDYGERPPKLPANLVQMHHTTRVKLPSGKAASIDTEIAIPPDDVPGRLRSRAVERDNEEAARHDVRGCLPPRWIERHECWKPTFESDWRLHARRYSIGSNGQYQGLAKDERKEITIDGEPVVEIDVQSSHLTILHGLLKLPLPEGDLYAVPPLSRDVVKAWIVQTLGNGRLKLGWSKGTPKAIKAEPFKAASRLILKRYPLFADLQSLIPARYSDHPEPWRLLPHVLMGLEASAMAIATGYIRQHKPGTLVMPVHDSLIVPWDAEEVARKGIVKGYEIVAGITPRID